MNLTLKKVLLQCGGFVTSVAPLAVVVGLNWGKYTATTASTVSLGIGGVLAIALVSLKALGKLPKDVKPLVRHAAVFALIFTLNAIIQDLVLLYGMYLVGEAADTITFERFVAKTQKQIDAKLTAEATSNAQQAQTDAIVEAIKSINVAGRV